MDHSSPRKSKPDRNAWQLSAFQVSDLMSRPMSGEVKRQRHAHTCKRTNTGRGNRTGNANSDHSNNRIPTIGARYSKERIQSRQSAANRQCPAHFRATDT